MFHVQRFKIKHECMKKQTLSINKWKHIKEPNGNFTAKKYNEIKNLLHGLNKRSERVGEKNRDFQDQAIETTQTETQKRKKKKKEVKKTEQRLREPETISNSLTNMQLESQERTRDRKEHKNI